MTIIRVGVHTHLKYASEWTRRWVRGGTDTNMGDGGRTGTAGATDVAPTAGIPPEITPSSSYPTHHGFNLTFISTILTQGMKWKH